MDLFADAYAVLGLVKNAKRSDARQQPSEQRRIFATGAFTNWPQELQEGKLSDEIVPKADTADMKRNALRALLRDVTAQRDKLLAEYEAMALQVDESTREIDYDILQAQQYAEKAEAGEHRAAEETARANELARQLDEERRKSANIAEEFARFRYASVEHASLENPRAMLWRAISLIACECVAWMRAKIPPDGPLLPWFDRAIEIATKAGRLAWKWANAFIEWATPRVIDLWRRLKSEARSKTSPLAVLRPWKSEPYQEAAPTTA